MGCEIIVINSHCQTAAISVKSYLFTYIFYDPCIMYCVKIPRKIIARIIYIYLCSMSLMRS